MLENLPLFCDLGIEHVTRLEAISKQIPVQKGTLIFSPGDAAKGFFAVLAGAVRLYRVSAKGKEVSLDITDAGHTFAEASLFSSVYRCYAEAMKDSTVCLIGKDAFLDLIRNDPTFAVSWLRVLSLKVIGLARQVEELSLKTPRERIVSYILLLADIQNSGSVTLPAHRKSIATLLGMSHETFYRTTRELENEGLLHFDGCKIDIVDRCVLEELVE